MNYYSFPDKKVWKFTLAFVLLGLLILNRDGMYSMAVTGLYPALLGSYGLIGMLGIAFLAVNRKQLKAVATDRRLLVVLLSTVVMLLPMVIKKDWQLMYVNILLAIYIGIFFSYILRLEELSKHYVLIITVLGVLSLIALYVLRPLTDAGILNPAIVKNAKKIEIYNYYISFVPLTFVKNRNFGIFREPGVYQYFILLGIYLNNYRVNWDREWKLWAVNGLLAVTMLSTFATGGVIELGLLCVVMFFDKGWYKERKLQIAAAVLVAAAVGLVGYCIAVKNGLYWALYDMFMKFRDNPESTGARVGSIFVNLEFFLKNPLMGAKLHDVLHLTGVSDAIVTNTSSTMILFAAYGILGGIFGILGWIALVWDRDRRLWANLALLIVLFMSFNTQNLTADVFFWLFPYMALTQALLPKLKLPERKI